MGRVTAPFGARPVELGAVAVWCASTGPLTVRRRPSARDAGRRYHLVLLPDGEATVVPAGAATVLPAGAFCVGIPEALLPLPRGSADALLGRRLSSRDGVGAVLARFLAQLTRDAGAFQPSDGPRLGTVLCDLVAALFTLALEAGPALPPDPHRRTLVSRVEAFVQRHLSDPELTPTAIAAAHGISLSYLHRVFQGEHETVAVLIRRQRLERARFDLADPAQAGTPVHTIAARWGFPRATDFARAFRAAYGIPPTDYRRSATDRGGRIAT
ncbi:helix-turn-helix domain-containing protein [Streptomyces sp. NPDC098781]|uniref:helix-turn-helix domain-containing protein n=1 Tax=Streptomyces sp. NPDC098781 TaxID=3366097 RepID=UPI00380C7254